MGPQEENTKYICDKNIYKNHNDVCLTSSANADDENYEKGSDDNGIDDNAIYENNHNDNDDTDHMILGKGVC